MKAARKIAWFAVPVDRTLTEFQFVTEQECRDWIAQPICAGHYRPVRRVVAQCRCCGLFHVEKPSESVLLVDAAKESGRG